MRDLFVLSQAPPTTSVGPTRITKPSFDPDEGYSGLVTDRKAFIAYARGGNYSDDAAMRELDHQTTYMPQILGFMGITDVESVTVEPTLHEGQEVAEEKRDLAIDRARTIAENF
ncbi:MAG: NAD(P)H-dependent oxidoreductase [Candidatus Brocadiia bacterium]